MQLFWRFQLRGGEMSKEMRLFSFIWFKYCKSVKTWPEARLDQNKTILAQGKGPSLSLRWKPPIISVRSDFHFLSNRKFRRSDFRKCVQIFIFFKSQI